MWCLLAPASTRWQGDPMVLTLCLSPPFPIRVAIVTMDLASGSPAKVHPLKCMPLSNLKVWPIL